MNEIVVQALADRIKEGLMLLEELPSFCKAEVQEILDAEELNE